MQTILNWKSYLIKYVTANLLIDLLSDKKPLLYSVNDFNGHKIFNIHTEIKTGGVYNPKYEICTIISFGAAKARVLMANLNRLNDFDSQPKNQNGFISVQTAGGEMLLDKYQASAIVYLADKIREFISNPLNVSGSF